MCFHVPGDGLFGDLTWTSSNIILVAGFDCTSDSSPGYGLEINYSICQTPWSPQYQYSRLSNRSGSPNPRHLEAHTAKLGYWTPSHLLRSLTQASAVSKLSRSFLNMLLSLPVPSSSSESAEYVKERRVLWTMRNVHSL